MTKQTSSTNSSETDCLAKYQGDPDFWEDVWEKVQTITSRDMFDEKCWLVEKRGRKQNLLTERNRTIQIEVNKDEYVKVNITFPRLDENGQPIMRKYKHNQTGKEGVRTDTRKESMYLHHLAYLHGHDTDALFRRSAKAPEQRHTLSHLCNRRGCFNPKHISFEAHIYNLSRNSCNAELCKLVQHEPPCLTHINSIISTVSSLNQKLGYGPSTLLNEIPQSASPVSGSSEPSTVIVSSARSSKRKFEWIDDDLGECL